jgi:TIR domain
MVIDSRTQLIEILEAVMVFISHRQADENVGVQIKDKLKVLGVDAYIDVLDPKLKKPIDVTKRIVEQLRRCSHIIAVFTANTAGSLWVPFELGAAYEADKGIGTYVLGSPTIPEYLDAFPIMRSVPDLRQFAEEYKKQATVAKSLTDGSRIFESAHKSETRMADDFIYRLKSKLGQ